MYYVYVLYSSGYNKIYIGYTSDLDGRVVAHNHEKNKGWTKSFQPWKLVYHEAFDSKSEALRREQELKSQKGREYIRQNLLFI